MNERLERLNVIPLGAASQFSKTITEGDAYLFAGVTGDRHPLYTDAVTAAAVGGGERVVPPAFAVGLISGVMAKFSARVPSPGAVSYRYDLSVCAAMRYGDTITALLEAVQRDVERHEIILAATCRNQDGTVVLQGRTILKVL